MAVLLLKLNLPHCPIWIAYSSQGFDIGANNLLWNLMDMTQIFFSRKDKHDNFEVFINESVSSKANTEVLKSAILSNTAEFWWHFYYKI